MKIITESLIKRDCHLCHFLNMTTSLDQINSLVHSFTKDEIESIFADYDSGCFDHLLRFERNTNNATHQSKCQAIQDYLIQTIMVEPECDRQRKFVRCTEDMSSKDFIRLLQNDQYFSEPLMHTLNQGKRDYTLRMEKENN